MELEGVPIQFDEPSALRFRGDNADARLKILLASVPEGQSKLAAIIKDRRLSFQSLKEAKDIFKATYKFPLADCGKTGAWDKCHELMQWRHRVVHISPTTADTRDVPAGKPPAFVSDEAVSRVVEAAQDFVAAVHAKSLE
jgi:hypothetical protein